MYGHGPVGGHRGPMGGPAHHRPMGFGPGMGYRPTGMRYRPYRRPAAGFFPMGGLFILPALMFGGWIAVAVLGSLLSLAGTIIGGVFEGLDALAEGTSPSIELAIGIAIGLAAYFWFRKRKKEEAARRENSGTVDGVEVEQIIETEKHRGPADEINGLE